MTYQSTSKNENFRKRTASFSTHGSRSTLESINTVHENIPNNHKLIPMLDAYFKLRDDCRKAKKSYRQKQWRFNNGKCSIGSIDNSVARLAKIRAKRDNIKARIDAIGVGLSATWYLENYVKPPEYSTIRKIG